MPHFREMSPIVCVLTFTLFAGSACAPSASPTQAPRAPTLVSATVVPPTPATAATLTLPTPDVSRLKSDQLSSGDPSIADQAARDLVRSVRDASGIRAQLGNQADEIFRLVDRAEAAAVQDIVRQLEAGKPKGMPAPLPPRLGSRVGVAQFASLQSMFGLLVTTPGSILRSLPGSAARPIESTETLGENVRAHVKMTPKITGPRLEIDLAMSIRVEKDGAVYEEESSGKISLTVCPDQGGNVPLDLTFQSGGGSSGAGYGIQFTHHAIGHVDDEGNLTSIDHQVQTELSAQGGPSAASGTGGDSFVQVNQQFTLGGLNTGDTKDWSISNSQASIPRASPQVSPQFVKSAAELGAGLAGLAAMFAFNDAESKWQDGYCVAVAVSEGGEERRVRSSSETSLTATVRHKFEGNELGVPVIAMLTSGTVSVTPSGEEVPAPATFRYKAPDKAGEKATVELVSRSRRGIGKLTITFKTEEPYYVDGDYEGGRVHLSGVVCALDKPFTIKIEGRNAGQGQFVGDFVFTPAGTGGGSWKHKATTTCLPDLGCGTVEANGTYQFEGIADGKPVLVLNPTTQTSRVGGLGGTSYFPGLKINLEPATGVCSAE